MELQENIKHSKTKIDKLKVSTNFQASVFYLIFSASCPFTSLIFVQLADQFLYIKQNDILNDKKKEEDSRREADEALITVNIAKSKIADFTGNKEAEEGRLEEINEGLREATKGLRDRLEGTQAQLAEAERATASIQVIPLKLSHDSPESSSLPCPESLRCPSDSYCINDFYERLILPIL